MDSFISSTLYCWYIKDGMTICSYTRIRYDLLKSQGKERAGQQVYYTLLNDFTINFFWGLSGRMSMNMRLYTHQIWMQFNQSFSHRRDSSTPLPLNTALSSVKMPWPQQWRWMVYYKHSPNAFEEWSRRMLESII